MGILKWGLILAATGILLFRFPLVGGLIAGVLIFIVVIGRLKNWDSVKFDDTWIHAKIDPRYETWDQNFKWDDIVKVVFKNEGKSDRLFIFVSDRDEPHLISLGTKRDYLFFTALIEKEKIPALSATMAMDPTNAGTYSIWPDDEQSEDTLSMCINIMQNLDKFKCLKAMPNLDKTFATWVKEGCR